MRVDLVESEVPLAELQTDLNAGKWLLVNGLLINPTRIDSIVEVKNEEEDHGE
ncbi:MAG: hypothetical protein J6U45_08550 [Alistipes sp.]|nr:hypothetical protein [Alistipes sp.]